MEEPQETYLGLGSNLGDRLGHLLEALRRLYQEGLRIVRCSSLYDTAPWGLTDQPRFLNLVCHVETPLAPEELLAAAKRVEELVGRRPRDHRYGPREIDIDLLLCGALVVSRPELEVPHPRIAERTFVLVPLVELAPRLRHPVLGLTMGELLASLQESGDVQRWGPPPEATQPPD